MEVLKHFSSHRAGPFATFIHLVAVTVYLGATLRCLVILERSVCACLHQLKANKLWLLS